MRHAFYLLWAVVSGGCLKDSLTPCGDLSCPTSAACVMGRCVPTEALAACAGLEDGVLCTTSQLSAGVCGGQVCIAAGCGNGVLDGDELCDDGNTQGNDGCSEGCDSLETCGDGVRNFGEQCDCGDDPSRTRSPCTAINSDTDAASQCRADCTLKTCGNGIVEGIEQCEEGQPITTATCETFGYYGGALGCTAFCQLEPSGCVGRCGDGSIQGVEQCDGANLGSSTTCTQIGYYRGSLACNALCSYAGCNGRCGDGVWDQSDGEGCDTNLRPTCSALGFYGPGTAGCTGACTPTPGSCARCGDGIVQATDEDCDGLNLDGETCATLITNATGSDLRCTAACNFDISGCTTCGNGTCEMGTDCPVCPQECPACPM
jgi:cysteine-rich repeat protein